MTNPPLTQPRDHSHGTPAHSALLPILSPFRSEPRKADRDAVRQLVADTGMFRPAEVEIAGELVDERLQKGQASGYEFLFLDEILSPAVTTALPPLAGYACHGPIAGTTSSHDLYWIAVAPAWQGRGLGRRLLAECERIIRAAGGSRVYIETSSQPLYEPTRAFYRRCGYHLAATLPDFYAPGDDKLIYVKAWKG